MAPPPIYINGRFATQAVTGVQRFALEITTALRTTPDLGIKVLAPAGPASMLTDLTRVGRFNGQVWEQLDLPRYTRDGYLINLGNTAPLFASRQLVVIHDAGVFSTPQAYSWRFRTWYKFLQRGLALQRTHLVTVSEFSRSEIARHLRVPAETISVIPEGADHMHRIAPDNTVLATHGLQPGGFVLIVGSLAAHKNLAGLGALAKMLAAKTIPLVITGRLGSAVFQSDGREFLPEPAQYIGRVSDEQLKALYTAASCFVFPSIYEGFGLPQVEAMACGCPVVAADIPPLKETGGTAVLYCDPQNPGDIAAKVQQLLEAPALRARLQEDGLRQVKNMTWQSAAASLAAIITQHRGTGR
jgi:glycosyltransferase involved in cell wall biosynthesis